MVKIHLMACLDITEFPPLVKDVKFYPDPPPQQTLGERYISFYQFQDSSTESATLAGENWLRSYDPVLYRIYAHYRNVNIVTHSHWLQWIRKTYQLFFIKR